MGAPVAPMTFLQLAQRFQRESGTSGAQQTTVVNATGEWLRLCDWIAQVYVELQLQRPDWEWMEQDVVFDTIAGQQSYSPTTTTFTTPSSVGIADFRSWKLTSSTGTSSFRLYLKSAGVNNETYLDSSLAYSQFRDQYIYGARRNTQARPISICVDPQKNLLLGLLPNDVYTVNGKYYQAPILMSADADTPAFPARYHMILVYKALIYYGLHQAAPEAIAKGKMGLQMLGYGFENEQTPEIQLPDALC